MAQLTKQPIDISPDFIPTRKWDEATLPENQNSLNPRAINTSPIAINFQSTNFRSDNVGWLLDSSGIVQFNGNAVTSTNFTLILSSKGVNFYCSNGTTPNGNLSGSQGDICFNANGGRMYYCTGTTNWTAM